MTMPDLELVIGDKNWSSWSLRPWLLLRHADIPFRETHIRLRQDDTRAQALRHSPSGHVPVLKWNGEAVWDSLAIAETIADLFPEKMLLPEAAHARAAARSISAEMHSGFTDLRRDMPMDIINRYAGEGHSEGALACAKRIVAIWREARARFGATAQTDDGFLFGRFGIADAMYAPIVTRFRTYEVDLKALGDEGSAAAYMKLMLALPAFREWEEAAKAEMAERS